MPLKSNIDKHEIDAILPRCNYLSGIECFTIQAWKNDNLTGYCQYFLFLNLFEFRILTLKLTASRRYYNC